MSWDALTRTGAAFLRTDHAGLEEAIELGWLPGITTRVSVEVQSAAGRARCHRRRRGRPGRRRLDPEQVGALRDAIAPRPLLERTALPPETEIDDAAPLARPLFTAWLKQIDGSGVVRPRYTWAPGRDEEPPVPARRLSAEWEDAAWREGSPDEGLSRLAPELAGILERSLGGRRPAPAEVEWLFRARGDEVEAVAAAADELRRRAKGDTATYVVNRNINYTNRCTYRCGFCALSRGRAPLPAGSALSSSRRGGARSVAAAARRGHRGTPAGRHPPRLHR